MKRTFLFRLIVALTAIGVPAGFLRAQVQVRDTVQSAVLAVAADADPLPPPEGVFDRNLLTPSPDGCALMRSIQLPVNKYTGVANIHIPITEVKTAGNAIPVALSYQASGIKVQDVASSVGLGWRLVAGGRITRAVRGWPDNLEDFSSRASMLDDAKWTRPVFEERMRTRFDTEPDLFYFEYPGGSGMFVFDQKGVPVTIPGQNIQIAYEGGQFRLTDIDGTEYLFTTTESTASSIDGERRGEEWVSTWFLNHIRYADGSLVTYGYEATEEYVYTNYDMRTPVYYTASIASGSSQQGAQVNERITSGLYYSKNARITVRNPKYLSWIRYKDYRVDFVYGTGRTDVDGMRKLTEISVSHPLGGKKRYEFSYGTFANNSLKLLGVKDVSIADKAVKICDFEYYEDINLPQRDSYATDHWGYYNGRSSALPHPETDIISRVTGKPCHVNGLSKSPSLAHARANSIRLIRYAAGGTKEFQYELHIGRNRATGKMQETSGLRIGKILERASNGVTPSEYTYTYSGGVVYADTVNYCCYVQGEKTSGTVHRTVYHLSTQAVNEVTGINNCPVVYASVTERLPNGAYTVYQYVPYEEIWDSDAALYEVENGLVGRGREKEPVTPRSSRLWMRNLLQAETQYDADGSVVQQTSYTYAKEGFRRIHGYNCYTEVTGGATPASRYYVAKYYWDTQSVVVSKIETSKGRYNLGSTLSFEYDLATLLPTQIKKTDNLGNETRTTITYPSDYSTEAVSDEYAKGIKALKDRKMRSAPIETVVWKGGRVVDASINLYTVRNRLPVLTERKKFCCEPEVVRTSFPAATIGAGGAFVMASGYETMWRAEDFDLDNTVLTSVGKGHDRTSVLYGYQNQLPVAVVRNARHSTTDVASGLGQSVWLRSKDDTFTLRHKQVVSFRVISGYSQGAVRDIAIRVYDHATGAVCHRVNVASNQKLYTFMAELPAGTYRVAYHWLDRGVIGAETSMEAWAGVEEPPLATGGRNNEVFHTSFEEEGALQTTGNAYRKMPTAKSGEWVCQAPYTIDLSDFKPDTYQLTYWAYYPQAAKPRWQRVQTSLSVEGSAMQTYTLPASVACYIDEVRILPSKALMTTYTYKPGVGKLSETDPAGITTHYTYDDAGRLTSVRDGDRNLLKRYTYVGAAKIVEEAINGNAELQQTTIYLDGFGRHEQMIGVRASPTFKDMVHFWQYDKMGRADATVHLPYTLSSPGGGARRGNPYGEQVSFYNKLLGTLTTHYPYNYTFYDQTPQGKVLKTRTPKDSGRADALYETTLTYGFNTLADDVRRYELQQDSVLVWDGHYNAGWLRLEESSAPLTSETDRSRSRSFYNSDNQLVMTETLTAPGKSERTYYIYDHFGRLRYTVPEPGNELFGAVGDRRNPMDLHLYCYYTVYDRYGRVVKQLNPGAAWVYTLYDCRDRAVMMQKGEMRKENKWIFTYYDKLNRPTIQGVYTGGDFETHRAALEGGMTSYPALQSDDNVLTEIIYDGYVKGLDNRRYGFYPYTAEQRVNVEGQVVTRQEQANYLDPEGREAGRRCKVLGVSEPTWLTTVNYYDKRGQLIETVSDLYPNDGRTERVINHRNAVGNIAGIYVRQEGGGLPWPVGYSKEMTYDHRDRLSKVSMLTFYEHLPKEDCPPGYMPGYDKHNDKVDILRYTYDELGRVKTKSVHNGLETTTYTYDLRGRQLSSESPLFAYQLAYDRPSAALGAPRYDGLVSQATWKHGTSEERGYAYAYDAMGQLTAAQYAAKSSDGAWTPQDKFAERVTYGTCGRIARIERTDAEGVNTVIEEYPRGYRMIGSITDGKRSQTFRYDTDGNLVYDGNQLIQIKYNILGLTEQLFDNNVEVRYIWTSDGRKLAKAIDGSYTYYCNTMEYDASRGYVPSRIHHSEGFVSTTDRVWEYHYYKKDHVGNVRALLRGSGTGFEERQRMGYYPFGSAYPGSYRNLHVNRRLFSGKELEDAALGPQGMVGWYDYGARMYNPHYGRWLAPDPLSRKYVTMTPYGFCGNNPICNVDPFGMDHWTVTDPDEIAQFLREAIWMQSGSIQDWFEERGDGSYSANGTLNYNDNTHQVHYCYNTQIDGVVTAVAQLVGISPSPWFHTFSPELGMQEEWSSQMIGTGGSDLYSMGTMMLPSVVEFGSGFLKGSPVMLGDNGKLYRPKPSGRVFRGNQYVTVYSVGKAARAVGRVAAGVSAATTGFQVWNDFQSGHPIKGIARGTYSLATNAVNLIPVVGPFISIGMSAFECYYGERMYQWIEDSVICY